MSNQNNTQIVIEPDDNFFLKHIDAMIAGMTERFRRAGMLIGQVFVPKVQAAAQTVAAAGAAPASAVIAAQGAGAGPRGWPGGVKPAWATPAGAATQGAAAGGTIAAPTPTGGAAQTPQQIHAAQLKAAQDLLRLEREKRDIQRAARFSANRAKYGPDVELDENGRPRKEGASTGKYVSAVATGINAAGGLAFGGGSIQSTLGASVQIASLIAPQIAPVLNAFMGVANTALDANNQRLDAALRGYQVGGTRGANQILRGTEDNLAAYRELHGFDIQRFSALQTSLARKTGGMSNLRDLMGLENAFGLDGQGVNLLGASARSGNSTAAATQSQVLGSALALALAEGLGRGRIGETFDQIAGALDENTRGVGNFQDIANRFLFISQLGSQYRGNTAAAREMSGSLQGLARGDKPYTQMSMLNAAGFGKPGVSYSEAWLRAQRGLDVQGGVTSEQLIMSNYGTAVAAYARGNAEQKASIVMMLSQQTGMNGAQVQDILERLSKGPISGVNTAAGVQRMNQEGAMNNDAQNLLRHRQEQVRGQNAKVGFGSFLQWVGTFQDERRGLSKTLMGPNNPFMTTPGTAPTTTAASPAAVPSFAGASTSYGDLPSNATLQQFRSQGGRFGVNRDTGEHKGEDLFIRPGSDVFSPCDGVVTVCNYFAMPGKSVEKANGYAVWIKRDGDGMIWKLVHLQPDSVRVRVGSRVTKGDKIGTTLTFSKWKNGVRTHLHVGLASKQGKTLDPFKTEDLTKLTNPNPGVVAGPVLTPSASLGATATAVGGTSTQASQLSGPVTQPSQTVITVHINDRTSHGVDVQQETARFDRQAAAPSPGDMPVTKPEN